MSAASAMAASATKCSAFSWRKAATVPASSPLCSSTASGSASCGARRSLRPPKRPALLASSTGCLRGESAARCRLCLGCGCPLEGCAQPAAPRSAASNLGAWAGSRTRQPQLCRLRGHALGNEERCRPRTALPGAARAHARRPRRTPWPAARAPRAACARSPAPPLAPRPPRCRARWAGLRQGRRCGRRRPPPWPRLRRPPRAAPPGTWRAPAPESLQHRVTETVDRRRG